MSTLNAPDPNDYPASGGGWISGPMTAPATPARAKRMAKDDSPEYSPTSLILDVRAVLERAGIQAKPVDGQVHQATVAASNLLRALGVRPTTPERATS